MRARIAIYQAQDGCIMYGRVRRAIERRVWYIRRKKEVERERSA